MSIACNIAMMRFDRDLLFDSELLIDINNG